MLRATWNLLLLLYAVEILIIASSLDNIFPPAQLTFSINPQSLYARHPNLTAAAEFYHISRIDHQYSRNIPIHIYQKYYDILGPEAVLFIMENNTFCNHDRTHNFGRVIYQNIAKLVNSVKICRNKCTGGCWHGVLMQYFEGIKDNIANASVSDATNLTNVDVGLYPYFNALCKGSDELAMLISKYYSLGDCYHGLGHAVTYLSEYDPFRAITNCKSIPEKLQSYYCATGAFHEYFLRLDGKRVGDSLLYPCDKTNDFPAACYRTWFLHVSRAVNRDSAYLSLAMICKDMHDDRQRQGCFHGYGLHVSNLALRGVVPLSKLCYLTDERVSQHMCVEGAAGALSMMIPPGSTRVVHMTRMCESLDDRIIQTLCLEAGNEGMNKDPKLYYSIGPVSGKDINNSMLSFRLLSAFNHRLSLEEVDEYYSLIGPAAILSVMEAESVCHDKALVVGRVVYVHTNNFSEARVICGARCSAGCLNGVVVQHFLTWKNRLPVSLREGSNITLFLDALGDRFSQFCAVELANFTTSSCYHSLGYAAFALADADVRLSARYCDALEDHLGAYYCATGLYHEYFVSAAQQGNLREKAPSPLYYPCDTFKFCPAACYRSLFAAKQISHETVEAYCTELRDIHQRLGCWHGFGLMMFRRVAAGEMNFDQLCRRTLGWAEKHVCIEGAAGAINILYSKDVRTKVCADLQDGSLHIICENAGDKSMNKDVNLYYSVG